MKNKSRSIVLTLVVLAAITGQAQASALGQAESQSRATADDGRGAPMSSVGFDGARRR
jgi:hypothetical protein